jgi:hypothetical protein
MSIWTERLIFVGIGAAAGLTAAWHWYAPEYVTETYRPAVVQSDKSVILKRDPDAKPSTPAPKLPSKPTRTVEVKVKPRVKPEPVRPIDGLCPVPQCPAVTVRLDLVEQDEGQRVIASSPDGDIVGGIDIPHVPWVKRNENLWAVGATYDNGKRIGAFVDRDLGPFRVGIEADRDSVRVRAGIRF